MRIASPNARFRPCDYVSKVDGMSPGNIFSATGKSNSANGTTMKKLNGTNLRRSLVEL